MAEQSAEPRPAALDSSAQGESARIDQRERVLYSIEAIKQPGGRVHYRISDRKHNRIATCYAYENAVTVRYALNARLRQGAQLREALESLMEMVAQYAIQHVDGTVSADGMSAVETAIELLVRHRCMKRDDLHTDRFRFDITAPVLSGPVR